VLLVEMVEYILQSCCCLSGLALGLIASSGLGLKMVLCPSPN